MARIAPPNCGSEEWITNSPTTEGIRVIQVHAVIEDEDEPEEKWIREVWQYNVDPEVEAKLAAIEGRKLNVKVTAFVYEDNGISDHGVKLRITSNDEAIDNIYCTKDEIQSSLECLIKNTYDYLFL